MEIAGIDHVEFYVNDLENSVERLCAAYGFRVGGRSEPRAGADGQRSVLLRQGGITLLLTTAAAPHRAGEYLERHGDGVSVIALGTTDARAVFHETVRRGATPLLPPTEYATDAVRIVVAEVAGFGDVAHRFVERHGPAGEFVLAGIDASADPGPADTERLRLVDHVAVCLPAGRLDPAVQMYHDVFGFKQIFEEHIEVGDQAMNSKVVQSACGEITFTIIEPDTTRRPGQIDDFLAAHDGAGVQHLAYLTDDIVSTVRALGDRGVRFLDTPDAYYDDLERRLGRTDINVKELRDTNVLVDRDHWGEMFQIFAASEHARGTYFSEIIDRHGARSFGSGNIRALYEAVERKSRDTSALS